MSWYSSAVFLQTSPLIVQQLISRKKNVTNFSSIYTEFETEKILDDLDNDFEKVKRKKKKKTKEKKK